MKYYRCITVLIIFMLCSCSKGLLFDIEYKVIAHRGCWKDASGAENSLEGLFHAIGIGVDGVELDVCKTLDDSLVVAHGYKHGEFIISQTEFEALREVKLINGENLPTLYEYLSYHKIIGDYLELILEIKQSGEEVLILKELERFNLLNRVKVISFGWEICKEVKTLNPYVHVSYLNGDKSPQEVYNAGLNGIAYNLEIYKNNPNWLDESHSLGLTTYVWNIDKKSDFRWSAKKCVDYIVTDSPRAAKNFKSGRR